MRSRRSSRRQLRSTPRHQANFSLGVGAVEVEKIVVPVTYLIDTAAGYEPHFYYVFLEPFEVAANARLAIRVASSIASALQFGPFKIRSQIT